MMSDNGGEDRDLTSSLYETNPLYIANVSDHRSSLATSHCHSACRKLSSAVSTVHHLSEGHLFSTFGTEQSSTNKIGPILSGYQHLPDLMRYSGQERNLLHISSYHKSGYWNSHRTAYGHSVPFHKDGFNTQHINCTSSEYQNCWGSWPVLNSELHNNQLCNPSPHSSLSPSAYFPTSRCPEIDTNRNCSTTFHSSLANGLRDRSHFSSFNSSLVSFGAGAACEDTNFNLPLSSNPYSHFSSSVIPSCTYNQFSNPPPTHSTVYDASDYKSDFGAGGSGWSLQSSPLDANSSQNKEDTGCQLNHVSGCEETRASEQTETLPFRNGGVNRVSSSEGRAVPHIHRDMEACNIPNQLSSSLQTNNQMPETNCATPQTLSSSSARLEDDPKALARSISAQQQRDPDISLCENHITICSSHFESNTSRNNVSTSSLPDRSHTTPRQSQFILTPSLYSGSETEEDMKTEQKPVNYNGIVTSESDVYNSDINQQFQEDKLHCVLPCKNIIGDRRGHKRFDPEKKRLHYRGLISAVEEPQKDNNKIADVKPSLDSSASPAVKVKIRKGLRTKSLKHVKSRNCKAEDRLSLPSIDASSGTASERTKKGSKTCSVCGKTFSRTDSLTVHMRVHTGARPFHCDQCDATYKVSNHLRNHIRSKHSDSRPYICGICCKAFAYPTARRRHEKGCGKDFSERVEFRCTLCQKGFVTAQGFERHKIHKSCILGKSWEDLMDDQVGESKGKVFQCNKCGKGFAEVSSLDRHQRFLCGKAASAGPYKCPECDKTFVKRYRYVIHSRHHTGDRPYQCSQCTACFFDRETWIRHSDGHGEKRAFKCSLCEKMFAEKRSLSMHIMRIHCGMKPYKCNECDNDFASASQLSTHIRRFHRKEKRFKCQLCFRAFFESQAWMKHMVLHARVKSTNSYSCCQSVRVRQSPRQYPCNLCNKMYFLVNMRRHVAMEHPGVALSEAVTKQLVKCDICLKEFSNQETLRVHKVRHTGEKPFKCDQCDMAFFFPSDLVVHKGKHTDARPYSCSDCQDTFRWSSSLRDHKINCHSPDIKVGEDGKGFACKECGQCYKRSSTLRSHMIRHRSVLPCICSICGKGFINNCRLKIHMTCHSSDSPRPFICEACGAGFFYTFLLKGHIQRKHTPSPWLCNLCGRSLCSKDALKRHIENHAKVTDGKVKKKKAENSTAFPIASKMNLSQIIK